MRAGDSEPGKSDHREGWSKVVLAISSGILLGLSFPPSPLYSLAYVSFIPFFYLTERVRSYGETLRYSYLFLFVFHLLTVYWAGGFTHARDPWMMTAGVALLFLHPFFYMPSILLARFVREKVGLPAGLVSFGLLWISYEYIHSLGEFTFPWMTIGNSQAYDLARSQIAEFTSVYGLSFLIFAFNIVAFLLMMRIASRQWSRKSKQSLVALGLLVLIYVVPLLYGRFRLAERLEFAQNKVRVGIIQPNIDPWEKWGEGFSSKWESYEIQLQTLMERTKSLMRDRPDLVLWPETAIPFHILLPRFTPQFEEVLRLVDSTRVPVFTGLPHAEYFDSATASVTSQRVGLSNTYVESYNSAVLIEPGNKVGPVYKKMVLVPFAERIPYAETFRFLIEPLKWNVGISSWGMGKETVLYRAHNRAGGEIPFSGMICYESVYPDFVRQFVKKGAQFLVVLTNDSWWGKTSGAYQHAAYASLRAIENRRWVVQCANGGVSIFVDPLGVGHVATKMFTTAEWVGELEPRAELTFYVRHGDVFAQLCLFCSGLFVILAVVRKIRIRKPNE